MTKSIHHKSSDTYPLLRNKKLTNVIFIGTLIVFVIAILFASLLAVRLTKYSTGVIESTQNKNHSMTTYTDTFDVDSRLFVNHLFFIAPIARNDGFSFAFDLTAGIFDQSIVQPNKGYLVLSLYIKSSKDNFADVGNPFIVDKNRHGFNLLIAIDKNVDMTQTIVQSVPGGNVKIIFIPTGNSVTVKLCVVLNKPNIDEGYATPSLHLGLSEPFGTAQKNLPGYKIQAYLENQKITVDHYLPEAILKIGRFDMDDATWNDFWNTKVTNTVVTGYQTAPITDVMIRTDEHENMVDSMEIINEALAAFITTALETDDNMALLAAYAASSPLTHALFDNFQYHPPLENTSDYVTNNQLTTRIQEVESEVMITYNKITTINSALIKNAADIINVSSSYASMVKSVDDALKDVVTLKDEFSKVRVDMNLLNVRITDLERKFSQMSNGQSGQIITPPTADNSHVTYNSEHEVIRLNRTMYTPFYQSENVDVFKKGTLVMSIIDTPSVVPKTSTFAYISPINTLSGNWSNLVLVLVGSDNDKRLHDLTLDVIKQMLFISAYTNYPSEYLKSNTFEIGSMSQFFVSILTWGDLNIDYMDALLVKRDSQLGWETKVTTSYINDLCEKLTEMANLHDQAQGYRDDIIDFIADIKESTADTDSMRTYDIYAAFRKYSSAFHGLYYAYFGDEDVVL